MYRHITSLVLFCFFSMTMLWAQVDIQPQRASGSYELGELAYFKINANTSGIAQYSIFYDTRSTPIESGKIELAANNEKLLSIKAEEPGFYLCEVSINGQTALASIAVAHRQLQAFEPEPSDFDAFWNAAQQELAAVPLDAEMTFHSNSDERTIYSVSMATVDNRRVYGYLTVPDAPGDYPAIIDLPPFGSVANLVTPQPTQSVLSNSIVLSISIHNAPPDMEDPNAYQPDIAEDPNDIYYKNAILAGIRAIDFIYTQDKFDGENVAVNGVSQGGGLAIAVAGLDSRVKVLGFSNAALCQHTGKIYDKAVGFPYFLHSTGNNFDDAAVKSAVKYVDAIYFAKRYKGATFATISHEDLVCPASTVFAAFNQIRGPKMVVSTINLGHDTPNDYWTDRVKFYRNFIPTMDTPDAPWFAGTSYSVDAGMDVSVSSDTPLNLSGVTEFDRSPNLNWPVKWELVEGPSSVKFSDANSRQTSATFSIAGEYILRFSAEDSSLLASDNKIFIIEDFIKITVN